MAEKVDDAQLKFGLNNLSYRLAGLLFALILAAYFAEGNGAGPGQFLFEAEDCKSGAEGGILLVLEDCSASGGKWLNFKCKQAGDHLDLSLPNISPGFYALKFSHGTSPRGGAIMLKVNGVPVGGYIRQREAGKRVFKTEYIGELHQKNAGAVHVRLELIGPAYDLTEISVDNISLTPVKASIESNVHGGAVPGASFSPPYASQIYKTDGSEIPADALDRTNYLSTGEWLDEMERTRKPGKIGSGTYPIGKNMQSRILTQSIYGYDTGGGRPVIDGEGIKAFLYLQASGVTVQYIEFRNMGYSMIAFDNWKDWHMGVESFWNTWAFSPKVMKDKAYDKDIDNLGVMDCNFENVGVALMIVQEFHGTHNVHIGRNYSSGGLGFVTIKTNDFDNIYFYQNKIGDHNQGTEKGNHVGTIFFLGTDDWSCKQKNKNICIEHNEIEDIQSSHLHRKINASVFADIRNCSDVSISFNICRNLVNTAGHSDCNAVYSKAEDLVIRGNIFENCGSNPGGSEYADGSEGGAITLKGETGPDAKFGTIVEDCTFIAGGITEVPMILFGHGGVIQNCTFKEWRNSDGRTKRNAIVRKYSGRPLTFINPKFENCGGERSFAFQCTEGDSAVFDWKGIDFDKNRRDIFDGVAYIAESTNANGEKLINKAK